MVADSTYFRAQEAAGRGQPIESHSSLRIRLLPCSLTAASASRTGAEVGNVDADCTSLARPKQGRHASMLHAVREFGCRRKRLDRESQWVDSWHAISLGWHSSIH